MTEEQYEIIRHDLNRLEVGVGIILALIVALIAMVGQINAQTLMPDGRILVSVDTACQWEIVEAKTPLPFIRMDRAEILNAPFTPCNSAGGWYEGDTLWKIGYCEQSLDSALDDSSNWWCEVVCDTIYDGSRRWDSTVVTGRDGKVYGTIYPCDTTWHRKQCLMVTPEEERQLRELLQPTTARKP